MPISSSPGRLAAAGCLLAASLVAGPIDSIAAVVGETVILESEVRGAVDFLRIASGDTVTPDSVMRRDVFDQLINNEILLEKAREDTISVTREEIASEVDAAVQSVRDRFPDEEQFQAALAGEGISERVLRKRYEEETRRKLLSQRLMAAEGLTQIYISPAEAEHFYESSKDSIARVPGSVTLAHILLLVAPGEGAEEDGQRRIAEVADILSRGGDFGVVAGSFSDDGRTAPRGGDWGWNDLSGLPLDVALVLDQLEPGQMSPPFRGVDGYLLVRLDARSGDRVRFRSILARVAITRSDTARAQALARRVRDAATAGADFDSLARAYSMDPSTADSGGYLGEFMIEGLTPPFDAVIAGLDSGDVSEPVLSEHGYHLVKVVDKVEARVMTYLEMQDMIRNYLYQERLNQRLADYLARIAQDVYVARYDRPVPAGPP